MVPSEKIVLYISWEVVSAGCLSRAARFAVLQEGTRAPFFGALCNGSFYAWPHIRQHTAFMAVPPSQSCFLTRYPSGIWWIWKAQVVLHAPRQPQDVQFCTCLRHPPQCCQPGRSQGRWDEVSHMDGRVLTLVASWVWLTLSNLPALSSFQNTRKKRPVPWKPLKPFPSAFQRGP